MKQSFLLVILFLLLALLQTSFLAHMAPRGFVIPVVLIGVVAASIFGSARVGLWGAFAGGLALDVFSQHMFGYWTALLVLVSCVVSFTMSTYVRFPFLKRG